MSKTPYPYNVITGQGLGVCRSSLKQVGQLLPSRPLGQAAIEAYANVSNGNLVVKDHTVKIVEQNGILEFGYIYNSQADKSSNLWHLGVSKRFTQLPTVNQAGSTATLLEADGHLTTYNYDAVNGIYSPASFGNGKPILSFDATNKQWKWFDITTGISEVYNLSGNLMQRQDSRGCQTTYEYDNNNQLLAVNGSSGTRYEIQSSRDGLQKSIVEICDGVSITLQSYVFDKLGRLDKTIVPNTGYVISYTYAADTNYLWNINQTDGTELRFAYEDAGRPLSRVKQIIAGEGIVLSIDYSKQPVVKLTDYANNAHQITLDSQARITQLQQYQGFAGDHLPPCENTNYAYTSQGQIAAITAPDGSQETFTYSDGVPDPSFGHTNFYGYLLTHTKPNGQLDKFFYDLSPLLPCLVTHGQALDAKTEAVTRYVYDYNYRGTLKPPKFLRFEISPTGRVTEYRPDPAGNIASKRVYLANTLDLSYMQNQTPVGMLTIQKWVAQQDPSKVDLTDYNVNSRGQNFEILHYTNVDAKGNGIRDAGMGSTTILWDEFGGWIEKEILQTAGVTAVTRQKYDGLHRLINVTDPLGQKTTTTYDDAKSAISITRPNGRVESKQYSSSGAVMSQQETAAGAARNTTIYRNGADQVTMVLHPDGQRSYPFYDSQQRLGYLVSASGIVKQYQYDRVKRYNTITEYYNPIDVKKMWPSKVPIAPVVAPGLSLLRQFAMVSIPDPNKDRVSYDFLDTSHRVQYQVDAKNILTETFYDNLDRVIGKVTYTDSKAVTSAELAQLKKDGTIMRTIDPTVDRYVQTFYDKDNHIVAKVDAAGYVTEYVRDPDGHVSQKILYDNITTNRAATTLAALRPTLSPGRDATTYYYRNARRQCIAEVDPENKLTQRTFLTCGLVQKEYEFYNPVADPNWLNDKSKAPVAPAVSLQDQTTVHQYDLLNRNVEVDTSDNKATCTQYDVMGHVTNVQAKDLTDPDNIDPDHQRSKQSQYDGFEQTTAEASANVAQLLTAIDADPTLTPAQKAAAKLQVWQNNSMRHTFDTTGLKLKTAVRAQTSDTADNVTYFYYDLERRPFITINAIGTITEKTLNSFNEAETTRVYDTQLTTAQLAMLTGGFITPALRQLLTGLQNPKDHVTQTPRDQRGQITQTIDPTLSVTTYAYNAFKECIEENLTVDGPQPSLKVQHLYEDPRGLETQTLKTAAGETATLKVTRAYNSPYGSITSYTDETNGLSQKDHDRKGRISQTIDPLQGAHNFSYDTQDRVLTETDSLNAVTQHQYDQTTRTHTTLYPVAGTKKIDTNNVHGEKISTTNGLDQTKTWTHTPSGKIETCVDELQAQSTNTYDLIDQLRATQDANGIVTAQTFNGAGQLTQKTQDATGLKLATTYGHDAYGNTTSTVDPLQITRVQSYDGNNRLTQTVTDPISATHPAGLNLVTQATYNSQGSKKSVTRGDAKVADQSYNTFQVDGFNRSIGNTVDATSLNTPNALNIISQKQLDDAGRVVVEIDPNNNAAYTFYDSKGQKRFKIDPLGGVKEWNYDAEGRPQYERVYCTKADPALLDKTVPLSKLISWASANTNTLDSLNWHYYDQDGKERFSIKVLGVPPDEKGDPQGYVTERRYDNAKREIVNVRYATAIDVSNLTSFTADQLSTIMQSKVDAANDRMLYYVRDAKGQDRFTIDNKGVVKEKRFDKVGRTIAEIAYAEFATNPAQLAALPENLVLGALAPDLTQARATYYVFDALGRPWFNIEPGPTPDTQAVVTQFSYDANGNNTSKCQFDALFTPPADYDAMVAAVQTFVANNSNAQKDRKTQFIYDSANRLYQKIDALNKIDTYDKDALGNIRTHNDRAGFNWEYEIDRALRLYAETAPETTITQVQTSATGKLTYTQSQQAVTKKTTYDPAGNTQSITYGYDLPDARTITFTYNACNKVTGISIANVKVDDPTQLSSLTNRPEKTVTLDAQIIYDTKQQKVAEKNFNGQWKFFVRDSLGRVVYEVDEMKGVVKREYNAFCGVVPREAKAKQSSKPDDILANLHDDEMVGEVINEVRINTPLNLDLSKYIADGTGIPQADLEAALQLDAAQDRSSAHQRDQHGDVVLTQKDAIFYYIAGDANTKASYGTARPQTARRYNAFREEVYQGVLIDPVKQTYAEKVRWYNRNGKLAADSNPNYYIKRYWQNSFKETIKRTEYANALTQAPTPQMSLAALDKTIVPSAPGAASPDRNFETGFDRLGQVITETKMGIVCQALMLNNGIPSIPDQGPQDLKVSYQYSPTEQRTAKTFEDGATEYYYNDARGNKMAVADVTRQNQAGSNLTPLTYYGVNAHNDPVMTLRFAAGTTPASTQTLPQPISTGADDQCQLSLFDNRGLETYKQDAEGYANIDGTVTTKATTYTASKKKGRTIQNCTNWQLVNGAYTKVKHIDDQRYTYDAKDRQTAVDVRRDNGQTPLQTTQTLYNAFDELTGEGPGNGVIEVNHRYDQTGKEWFSNAPGKNTIKAFDLAGRASLSGESATVDLSRISSDALPNFIAKASTTDLERTETTRDLAGQAIIKTAPQCNINDFSGPQDLPLQIQSSSLYATVFGKTSLTWPQIQECNVQPQMTLWLLANPTQKWTIPELSPIKTVDGRSGIDVSSLATDVYGYTMNYYLLDSKGNPTTQIFYTTNGVVQINSGANQKSLSLVAEVASDTQLQLMGNTQGLTAIQLIQNNQNVGAPVPVQPDPNNPGQFIADLSQLPSGTYTAQPIGGKLNTTLPFTIFTPVPSQQPVAREIDCSNVQINVTGTSGTLSWQLPSAFNPLPVNIICVYQGTDGKEHVELQTIQPGESQENGIVQGTLNFNFPVQTIQRLSMSLQLNAQDKIPFYISTAPLAVTEDHRIAAALPKRKRFVVERDKKSGRFKKIEKQQDKKDDLDYKYDAHGKKVLPSIEEDWEHLPDLAEMSDDEFDMINHDELSDGPAPVVAKFPPRVIMYITPLQSSGVFPPNVTYLDTSLDRQAQFKQLAASATTAQGVVVDVTSLQPGNYPYQIGDTKGTFTIDYGSMVYSSTPPSPVSQKVVQPMRTFKNDAWGNRILETDSYQNTTSYIYNVNNKMAQKTEPMVEYYNSDGTVGQTQPVTKFGFNKRGSSIGICDANSNTEGYVLNAAGFMTVDVLPDGTLSAQDFNALNNKINYTTAGNLWKNTFDHNNRLIANISPYQSETNTYGYNEQGYRNFQSDPAGCQMHYVLDPFNNTMVSYDAGGGATTWEYDRNNQPLKQTNPDGSFLTWLRNYFGTETGHTDLSGATYTSALDYKNQVKTRTSSGGNHGEYIQPIVAAIDGRPYIQGVAQPVPGQNLSYVYAYGRVVQMTDLAQDTVTYYTNDLEGRRIHIRVEKISSGLVLRDTYTTVDQLGREKSATDGIMSATMGYDRVGNRRFVITSIYNVLDPGDPYTQSMWYAYDTANRTTFDACAWIDGNLSITPQQGSYIYYTNGLRSKQVQYDETGKSVLTTTFTPRADGVLSHTITNNSQGNDKIQDDFFYNGSGWQTAHNTYVNGNNTFVLNNSYTNTGWQVTSQQFNQGTVNATLGYGLPPSRTVPIYHYGLAQTQNITYASTNPSDPGMQDHLVMQYVGFDSWMQSSVSGDRTVDYKGKPLTGPYTTALNYYGANGEQNAQIGNGTQVPGATDSYINNNVYFATTPDNLILHKLWMESSWVPGMIPWVAQSSFFYSGSDNYLGMYTVAADDYGNQHYNIVSDFVRHSTGGRGGFELGVLGFASSLSSADPLQMGGGGVRETTQQVLSGSRFGELLLKNANSMGPRALELFERVRTQTINGNRVQPPGMMSVFSTTNNPSGSVPMTTMQKYTVVGGDTFASIAQRTNGDSRYAAAIAFANGYPDSLSTPQVGTTIKIPAMIPVYNGAQTSIAYQNLYNNLVGALQPIMSTPAPPLPPPQPPPPQHHSSFWGELVEMVAVVVVSIVAPEVMAALAPFLVGTLMGSATIAAVTGAVASAVGQGVGEAVGLQNHFSLKEVLISGLESGVTAGLGAKLGVTNTSLSDMQHASKFITDVVKIGAINVTEQLSEIAVGLKSQFSLRQVADYMASTIADNTISAKLKLTNNNDASLTRHAVGNTLIYSSNSLIDDAAYRRPVDLTNLAATALGANLGTYIGIPIAQEIDAHAHALQRRLQVLASSSQPSSQASSQPSLQPATTQSPHNDLAAQLAFSDQNNTVLAAAQAVGTEPLGISGYSDNSGTMNGSGTSGLWPSTGTGTPATTSNSVSPSYSSSSSSSSSSQSVSGGSGGNKATQWNAQASNTSASGNKSSFWNDLGGIASAANEFANHMSGGKVGLQEAFARSEMNGLENDFNDILHGTLKQAAWGTAGVIGTGLSFASPELISLRSLKLGEALTSQFKGFWTTGDETLKYLSPNDIKFSQPTVSPNFNNNTRVDDLVASLKNGTVLPEQIPTIKVVAKDGNFITLDNRRLLAFNTAGINSVPVEIVSLDDPVIAKIFDRRFNPIGGEGNFIAVAPAREQAAVQQQLQQNNLIRGNQLGY